MVDATPSRVKRSSASRVACTRAPAHSDGGFTLVDLVTVIAIVAVLASLAAPSFSAFIASPRAGAAATDLYVALTMARSEATKRSTNVTLASAAGGWQNGWNIADPVIGGRKVLTHDALASAVVTGPDTVVYQRSGRVRGAAPSFTLTMNTGSAIATRCVQVDLNGRPYIKTC